MEAILVLILVILALTIIYYIYRYFAGMRIVSTDELYEQNGVTVEYKTGKIKIGKHTYDVNAVTGIKTDYSINGSRSTQHVKIEVDDIKKPVHRIVILGSDHRADQFTQRLSVAIRKANGPSFV